MRVGPRNAALFLIPVLVIVTFRTQVCSAQTAQPEVPMTADAKIASALQQVSAERIQANIEKLVSFGTRLTLSAQDPSSIAAGRGIGAAHSDAGGSVSGRT